MLSKLNRVNLTTRKVVEKNSFVSALEFDGRDNLGVIVAGKPQVLDATSLALRTKFSVEKSNEVGTLTGIRFVNQNVLVSSAADGYIRTYDIRVEKLVMSLASTLRPEANEELKPLISCDVSNDKCTVAAGSEAIKEDAFVLFWDIRNTKQLLGGYWESHSKDVSQVKFHPTYKGLLATGGVDGLVNVFDLEEGPEDDALQYTLNIECAVNHLAWLTQSTQKVNRLGVATTEDEFQLWEAQEAKPTTRLGKHHLQADVVEVNVDHIVAIYEYEFEVIFVTSSNHGSIDVWTVSGTHLTRLGYAHDKVSSSHKDLVKSAVLWSRDTECIMWTSGDDGIVCRWRSDAKRDESKQRNDRKAESSLKKSTKAHQSTPYRRTQDK